jgi:hypothetical protein
MENSKSIRALERTALDAHRDGIGWLEFQAAHGAAISAAEPINRQRYHRLVAHLLGLLVAGDLDGSRPLSDSTLWGGQPAAWELDDAMEGAT